MGLAIVALLAGTLLAPLMPAVPAAAAPCEQTDGTGCPLEFGQPASAMITSSTEIHLWRILVEAPGQFTLVATNLRGLYDLNVFGPDGMPLSQVGNDGEPIVVAEVAAALPGEYLAYLTSRDGALAEAPYLLVAIWSGDRAPDVGVPPAAPAASSTQRTDGTAPMSAAPNRRAPEPQPAAAAPQAAPAAQTPQTDRVVTVSDSDQSAYSASPFVPPPPPPPAPAYAPPPPPPVFEPRLSTPPPAPPRAARGLRARAINHHTIRLDWTDASDNELGFMIDGTGGYFTVGAGTTWANAGGLQPETTYCFKVGAFNDLGEGWSNEACATTPRNPRPN